MPPQDAHDRQRPRRRSRQTLLARARAEEIRAARSPGRVRPDTITREDRGRIDRVAELDRFVDDSILGRRKPQELQRELLRMAPQELVYVSKESKRKGALAETQRMKRLEPLVSGFTLGTTGLPKLLPGGTPASEATPGELGLDVLGLAPIGKGIKLGSAGARGVKRGVERVFRAGDLEVPIPAARSKPGRLIEGLLDKSRPVTGKTPLVRTEAEKAGAEVGRRVEIKTKLETAPAQALRKVARRLRPAEEYALRVVVEEAPIAQRIALHSAQAAKARGIQRLFHEAHVELLKKAAKHIDDSSGTAQLAAHASPRLRQALDLLLEVGKTREEVLKDIGRLSDEQIAERISQPGKVFGGARHREFNLIEEAAEGRAVKPGDWVRASDNIPEFGRNAGRVMALEGDTAVVKFVNRAEGTEATVRVKLSELSFSKKPKTGFFGEGAEFVGGKGFLSYARGVPAVRLRTLGAYVRASTRLFGGGARRTVGGGPDDITLRKAFTGRSIISGWFRTDTSNVAAESLVKASRLSAARMARNEFRLAATDIPTAVTDVAIREDFLIGKRIPEGLRQVWAAMDAVEASGRKLGIYELDALEGKVLTQLTDWMLPAGHVADDVLDSGVPIPGIKWVDQGFLNESKLFEVPAAMRMAMSSWGKLARAGGVVAGAGFDAVNDAMKALVLWLNPAYGPVQFIQNGLRLISEEGPLALAKLPAAFRLNSTLGVADTARVDSLMQMDKLLAYRQARLTPKALSSPFAAFQTMIADLGVRRAAFLIEAAKRGYDDPAKLASLLNDSGKFSDLEQTTRVALDVAGDFERLNGLEKTILSRVFWFWPWTHVAWRMTSRFPLDHPYQTAAAAAALKAQDQWSDEKLGERPWYAQFYVPAGTKPDGTQRVVNVGPLAFWTTPFTQAQAAYSFATGAKGKPQLADALTPFLGTAGEALYGIDSFTGRQTDPGLPAALAGLLEDIPLRRRVEEFGEDQEGKLRPRDTLEKLLQLGVGPIAPSGYDPEVGAKIVRREKEQAGQGPKLRFEDNEKAIDVALRKGELSPQEAQEFREANSQQYQTELRQKELKKRGLRDADLDRQLVIDDAVRQDMSLEELNEFLAGTGIEPITAEEFTKTERELLKLDVPVGR